MNRIGSAKLYVSASLLLPIACLFIWDEAWWPLLTFVAWSVMVLVVWIRLERKEYRRRQSTIERAIQTAAIRTLNHHRHDWMNELQVLYGYIRMNKQERVVQYVERVRDRMAVESRIAKLGVPALVMYLQSFRTMTNSLQLIVDIDGDLDIEEIPIDKEAVAAALIDLMNIYRSGVKPSSGDAAPFTLRLSRDDKALYAALCYDGEWNDIDSSMHKIKQRLKNSPLQPIGSEQSPGELLLKAELRG
jgi:hypothetical protein